MSEYFTKEELSAVKEALKGIAKVGIHVKSSTDEDNQRKVFFDKARLWNVIKKIITTLYMDGLIEGQKFLVDNRGEKWTVTRHRGVDQ